LILKKGLIALAKFGVGIFKEGNGCIRGKPGHNVVLNAECLEGQDLKEIGKPEHVLDKVDLMLV
jgi:hypothetical protein